jgi:hypothetical protein
VGPLPLCHTDAGVSTGLPPGVFSTKLRYHPRSRYTVEALFAAKISTVFVLGHSPHSFRFSMHPRNARGILTFSTVVMWGAPV